MRQRVRGYEALICCDFSEGADMGFRVECLDSTDVDKRRKFGRGQAERQIDR